MPLLSSTGDVSSRIPYRIAFVNSPLNSDDSLPPFGMMFARFRMVLIAALLVLVCWNVEAQVTILSVTRSVEINQHPKVTTADSEEFDEQLEERYISQSSGRPLST